MKFQHFLLLIMLALFTSECDIIDDLEESLAEENLEGDYISGKNFDPSFENPAPTGVLDFKMFSRAFGDYGKVLEGSDDEFNYVAYGNFGQVASSGIFVPKAIAFVESYQLGSNGSQKALMVLNEYNLPISYREYVNGVPSTTFGEIEYLSDKTIFTILSEDANGVLTVLEEIEFEPLPVRNKKINLKKEDDKDCDDVFEEGFKEGGFDPCKDNNVLDQLGDNMSKADRFFLVRGTGKFIKFVTEIYQENLCDDIKNKSFKGKSSKSLSCEDFEMDETDYSSVNHIKYKFIGTWKVKGDRQQTLTIMGSRFHLNDPDTDDRGTGGCGRFNAFGSYEFINISALEIRFNYSIYKYEKCGDIDAKGNWERFRFLEFEENNIGLDCLGCGSGGLDLVGEKVNGGLVLRLNR